jgi:hypothetical protein
MSGVVSSEESVNKVSIAVGLKLLDAIQKKDFGEVKVGYEHSWSSVIEYFNDQANIFALNRKIAILRIDIREKMTGIKYSYTALNGQTFNYQSLPKTAAEWLEAVDRYIENEVLNPYFDELTF